MFASLSAATEEYANAAYVSLALPQRNRLPTVPGVIVAGTARKFVDPQHCLARHLID